MSEVAITAVLNAHREGLLAIPSIRSLLRAIDHSRENGYSTEYIAVLDRPDDLTRAVFLAHCDSASIVETSFGDLGRARNAAVEMAGGRFTAFLDADDIWGPDWLTRAARLAGERQDPVVWHPEVCLYFGTESQLFFHVDMDSPDYLFSGLLINNYWTALSFSTTQIYRDFPYPSTQLNDGLGFEDWTWNMKTVGAGIKHKIVPGTGHVIRRKHVSLSRETSAAQAISHPGGLVRRLLSERQDLATEHGIGKL